MKISTITVGPIDENCYIVYCDKHKTAIIVDPGDSSAKIIRHIDEAGLKPGMIITTHCHADHTGAVAKLTEYYEIPFFCHADDEWMLDNLEQKEAARYLGLAVPPKNDDALTDGELVDLCDDYSLKVVHTPGHTPGGICLLGHGILIVGDTLFKTSIGRSDLTGGNHALLLKSIRERLLTLPDDTVVYPGHGEPTTIGYEKEHNPFLRQTEGYS
jgi:glyoxylase-like metal-dependent hydrolase (beta-lactamase superfamily II)